MREADIQKACLEMLHASRVGVFWRQNTGAFKIEGSGRSCDRFLKFGIPGQADITGLVAGMRVEIEVKRPGGKLRPSQEHFRDLMVEHGALYYVVDRVSLGPLGKPRLDLWTIREVIEDLRMIKAGEILRFRNYSRACDNEGRG